MSKTKILLKGIFKILNCNEKKFEREINLNKNLKF